MCEHNKVKSRCQQCVCPHMRELGKTGQCSDCAKAQREKEVAAGHLTDNRTDDEGRNMETDDEGPAGGRAGGMAADAGGPEEAEASATDKGTVTHLGQPPPPSSLPLSSAPGGVSMSQSTPARAAGDGDGSATSGSEGGASGLRAEGASVHGVASVSSAFTSFKPAPDGQGDDAKGKEPASAEDKK